MFLIQALFCSSIWGSLLQWLLLDIYLLPTWIASLAPDTYPIPSWVMQMPELRCRLVVATLWALVCDPLQFVLLRGTISLLCVSFAPIIHDRSLKTPLISSKLLTCLQPFVLLRVHYNRWRSLLPVQVISKLCLCLYVSFYAWKMCFCCQILWVFLLLLF